MPDQLRIFLDRTPIWPMVTIPETLTLGSPHLVVHQAMGLENRPLHVFAVGSQRYEFVAGEGQCTVYDSGGVV